MPFLSRFRDDVTNDLEAQLARLQKEVRSLRKVLKSRGGAAYDDAHDMAADLYDEFAGHVSDALPALRSHSRAVGRAASDHPVTTAVVGLALITIVIGLLSRK
jgi:hypothetical protein